MLHLLRIQNFALIDQVELEFSPGYSVITGETGSGKSILLHALNLILGERADFSVIGPASEKSVVEAEFELKNFHLDGFFSDNDLDQEEITLIRREIHKNGKSRAFINDSPVSLTVLKSLTSNLVNIHSQYNTLDLKSKVYQLDILDTLANLVEQRNDYARLFKSYTQKKSVLESWKEQQQQRMQQSDFAAFQLSELKELQLDKLDYAALESELKKIENGEELQALYTAVANIVEGEKSILDVLQSLRINMEKWKGLDTDLDGLSERIHSVVIELKDIASEAAGCMDDVEVDRSKLFEITELLNRYYHILRKHNAVDQRQLHEIELSLDGDFEQTENLQHEILALEKELLLLHEDVLEAGDKLHEARKNAIIPLTLELQSILEELKLPNTKLEFHLQKRSELNQYGATELNLLFSANVGMETVSIEKAASGGELSRVMLALQKLISEKKVLPTVLFDEIDTGVSGDVAQKIGVLLQKMGHNFQLLAISHLPQVAAKAAHHFKVEKEINGNRTLTSVRLLNEAQRVEEIARLMSGEEITEAALETAKSLMM
jgi:DNA repair protein RecN (Recombination protein N)